jgi:enoyl-CoA hydratase
VDFENLLYEVRDRVAVVTVNRPDKLNALNDATIRDLGAAIVTCGNDPEVGAVVITGAGEKAFVAGADIAELVELDALGAKHTSLTGQGVMSLIDGLGKPVVAAVNGFALGGGCELALACHMRVASSNAKLGLPEVGLGIIPGYGGTQRLPRIVGKGRALELILTGRVVEAEEALLIGLVNHVVEPGELMDRAETLARTMIANGPVAVRHALEAVRRGIECSMEEGLQLESDLFGLTGGTEDMKEGMTAFLEKRKPQFRGE